MNRSEQINELAAALAAAQAGIRGAEIDGVATITTKKGGQYGYTYTSLAAVWAAMRKPLTDNGLSVLQFPTYDLSTSTVSVETLLLHASGQWISNILAMPMADELTPQDIGSGIAYCRRYSLTAIVGVVGEEDDDGASASRAPTKAKLNGRQMIAREAAPAVDSQVYEHADEEFASIPNATQEGGHWITREDVRKRFWTWTKNQLGLTNAEVHEALAVEHIAAYSGTMDEAKRLLVAYHNAKVDREIAAEQPPVEPPTEEVVP